MSNLTLWESVCTTDPAHTKQFSRRGGFKGTATNATYLAKRATEVFGPAGIGWGIDVVDEDMMQGAPILSKDGEVICNEIIHKVRVKLWYMLDGKKGEVTQFGQTTFVGANTYGHFTDEEAPKKSLTDAMTKCLSLLGFAADVHLGMFDDNKYVNNLRREFSDKQEHAAVAPQPQPAASDPVEIANYKRDAETCATIKEIKGVWEAAQEYCRQHNDVDGWAGIKTALNDRKAYLVKAEETA